MTRLFWSCIALVTLIASANNAFAKSHYRIALIYDGPKESHQIIFKDTFIQELKSLSEGEFELEFIDFEAAWTPQSILATFDAAEQDPSIDMILGQGIASNQIGASRPKFKKPTFLPVLVEAPGNAANKANLNYQLRSSGIQDSIDTFQQLAPFKHAAFISDQALISAIETTLGGVVTGLGKLKITPLAHNGTRDNMEQLLPSSTDAVIFTELPRMSIAAQSRLVHAITARGIPSFSMFGESLVQAGTLATNISSADWARLARKNALNMQAAMLGDSVANLSKVFTVKHQLTVNMATARTLGIKPPLDLLMNTQQINPQASQYNQQKRYTLQQALKQALASNLNLLSGSTALNVERINIDNARRQLLPQIRFGSSASLRKDSSSQVLSGQIAEQRIDASLQLQQVLYSDDAFAGLDIQNALYTASEAQQELRELDLLQQTALAFINILRIKSQIEIQQENVQLTQANLDLAQDSVRIGSGKVGDQYRWQSLLATDQSALYKSHAQLKQAHERLNQLMHRPLDEDFTLEDISHESLFYIDTSIIEKFAYSSGMHAVLQTRQIKFARQKSPELKQLFAQKQAKKRELKNLRRDLKRPDVSLNANYNSNIGTVGGPQAAEHFDDWTVAINATLPIDFSRTGRNAIRRAELELQQLEQELALTGEQIEQSVRAAMHSLLANHINIDLSRHAADAAAKNLDLATDAYSKGAVSILSLLDAQNASIQANINASGAFYDYVESLVALSRSSANFPMLLSKQDQLQVLNTLRHYIRTHLNE